MKKILIAYYSQTGQLKEISDNLTIPFANNADFQIDYYRITPKKEYDFPWKPSEFYDVFPESFQQIPIEIESPPENILASDYDLVILAYQIWFLTPSIPVNSFLKSEYASEILGGRNVITIIGCRNMWAKAQQKTKILIQQAKGNLVGNVAFVDRNPNLISVITIVHWVMRGKKDKKWGIFPTPGVSKEDISNASIFGDLIKSALEENEYTQLQNKIKKAGGVNLRPFIIFMDETANRMFSLWSKFILKDNKSRKFKIILFKYYLVTVLFLISPIVFLIFYLTYPLRIGKIRKKRAIYSGI